MGRPDRPPLPEDHHCEWRVWAEYLEQRLDKVEAELEVLKRHVFGRRSEKMPPIRSELRVNETVAPAEIQAHRRERQQAWYEVPARTIPHQVPAEQRRCPKCGSTDLRRLGAGKVTTVIEHIPERFERQIHTRETLVCRCGEGIVTAEGPPKVLDKGHYGPGFIANLVVEKCGDSIPLYRLEKRYQRLGIPLSRSTMVEQFHGAAEVLAPIAEHILATIAAKPVVHADETPMRVQAPDKTRLAYLWTFVAENLVGYRFSPTRSGETPAAVLGTQAGALVVDAFTGYNRVTTPDGRMRVGCWAHVRRKFFNALTSSAREARAMMDFVLELYRVEYEARDQGLLGSDAHRELRANKSRAVLDAIAAWLDAEAPKHPPQSKIGRAISYTRKQWPALIRFADDPRLPLDNNVAERALRVAALGRKNYLFVGNDEAGAHIAGLYSLIATCGVNDVNPRDYLADVLIRVQTHPQSRIDELLPHRWKELFAPDAGTSNTS